MFLGRRVIYASQRSHLPAIQGRNCGLFLFQIFIVWFLIRPYFDCLEPMECCPCFVFGWKKFRGSNTEPALQVPAQSADSQRPTGSSSVASGRENRREDEKSQVFTFRELATATNNFRQESLLGEGGFGSVYRGKLEGFDKPVAVKMLNKSGLQGNKEFLVEVLMLSLLRHPNLVSLIGYCAEGDQRLLVYEFLPFGSLERHLHDIAPDKEPLDWNTRMKIASDTAKGLSYLHHEAQPPVIYRDLKSSNILLDEEFHAKLSDFGFAKFGPEKDKSHVSTRVMGTQGYCAPEYAATGKLTMQSDTYGFGILMLELITGHPPLDTTRGPGKKAIVDKVLPMLKDPENIFRLADPGLKGEFTESALKQALELATMCVREKARDRPSMKEVVLALDYLVSHPYVPRASEKSSTGARISESGIELTSPQKMTMEREQAVADAKKWGEGYRDMKEKGKACSSS